MLAGKHRAVGDETALAADHVPSDGAQNRFVIFIQQAEHAFVQNQRPVGMTDQGPVAGHQKRKPVLAKRQRMQQVCQPFQRDIAADHAKKISLRIDHWRSIGHHQHIAAALGPIRFNPDRPLHQLGNRVPILYKVRRGMFTAIVAYQLVPGTVDIGSGIILAIAERARFQRDRGAVNLLVIPHQPFQQAKQNFLVSRRVIFQTAIHAVDYLARRNFDQFDPARRGPRHLPSLCLQFLLENLAGDDIAVADHRRQNQH